MAATPPLLYSKFLGVKKETEGATEDKNLELRLGPPGQRKSSDGKPDKGFSALWSNEKELLHLDDNKAFSSAAPLPRTTQKRSSPAPVVGWPPVGSFRKNIASSTSNKQASLTPNKFRKEERDSKCEAPVNNHLFVKIYMDGFPIGRKINLRAYDSYEKLSVAIDELFGGLLAAQTETAESENEATVGENNTADANGEYTLVYEDNEGDRMLVGDVPWNMFVSTAKKLRVLRGSGLPSPRAIRSSDQEKVALDSAL